MENEPSLMLSEQALSHSGALSPARALQLQEGRSGLGDAVAFESRGEEDVGRILAVKGVRLP